MKDKKTLWCSCLVIILLISIVLYLGFPYITFLHYKNPLSKFCVAKFIEAGIIVIFLISYIGILFNWIKKQNRQKESKEIGDFEISNNAEAEEKVLSIREDLIKSYEKLTDSYQKTLMTFAGGSIILSITFLSSLIRVNGYIQFSEVLWKSLVFLAVSLISILGGMFCGLEARNKEVDQIDELIERNKVTSPIYGGNWNFWAMAAHTTSFFSCIFGIILLGFFIYFNIQN